MIEARIDGPGAAGDPLVTAFRRAIRRVDARGRVRLDDARSLRRALSAAGGSRAGLFADPELVLGAFDALPAEARQALVDLVAIEGRWRMAAFSAGRRHEALTRALWRLEERTPYGSRRRSVASMAASAVQAGPFFIVPAFRRRWLALRARAIPRPAIADFLAAAGVEIRDLAVRYVRPLPQLPRFRGFWHLSDVHSTTGVIVGIDLIENAQGYWVIETNMNCGLDNVRSRIFDRDPFVEGLLNATVSSGYRRLVFVTGNTSVGEMMTRQFREGAASRGIEVNLYEDSFHPRFGHPGTVGLPEEGIAGTLIVRNRHYRTAVDWIIHHKRASSRALRIYQHESGDTSFQLAPTSFDPDLSQADTADPFPNLVFKLPESDNGEGVVFLKVSSLSHAREILAESLRLIPRRSALSRLYARLLDRQGVFQSYVKTPWLPDRRLYKTRAYVLLTPTGTHFVAAHRQVGSRPVPEALPIGVVTDQLPYLVSWKAGSRLERVPAEELPRIEKAALGVARGLARSLEFAFESGPARDHESVDPQARS